MIPTAIANSSDDARWPAGNQTNKEAAARGLLAPAVATGAGAVRDVPVAGEDLDEVCKVLEGLAGGVTPGGQCQWSSWGSHEAPDPPPPPGPEPEDGGVVEGGDAPGGQCQWSSWASQVGAGGGRLVTPPPEEGVGGVLGGDSPGGQCQ